MNEEIGRARCPVCESPAARLRINKHHLTYVTCSGCHVQVFARGDRSDELLRKRHVAEAAPEPEQLPALPAPTKVQSAAATPAARNDEMAWGAFPWIGQ